MIEFFLNAAYAGIVASYTLIVFECGRAWEYANPTVKRKDRESNG